MKDHMHNFHHSFKLKSIKKFLTLFFNTEWQLTTGAVTLDQDKIELKIALILSSCKQSIIKMNLRQNMLKYFSPKVFTNS